jgi:hypothetical protein
MLILLFILAVIVIVWPIVAFNLLVRDRNRVAQAWSDVDVQLLRRHDLIPRLVDLVKGYSGYEKALLTGLTELRSQGENAASPRLRTEVEKSVGSGVAGWSRWSRLIRISRPARTSVVCMPVWSTPRTRYSLRGATTMAPSICTTIACSDFRISWSHKASIQAGGGSTPRKGPRPPSVALT